METAVCLSQIPGQILPQYQRQRQLQRRRVYQVRVMVTIVDIKGKAVSAAGHATVIDAPFLTRGHAMEIGVPFLTQGHAMVIDVPFPTQATIILDWSVSISTVFDTVLPSRL